MLSSRMSRGIKVNKPVFCVSLSVVSRFLELLAAQLLQSSSTAPTGLQFHILDLYMTELAAVGSAEVQQSLCVRFKRGKSSLPPVFSHILTLPSFELFFPQRIIDSPLSCLQTSTTE